ncbi:MAG TPA: LLM class flavin-dependent oxidoreductase [Micromonosporaceae bacterium]|jgi:hypothetical protein|nr:LLM class flavin-dependent oxidoreductase [Micromonosporaceae bacterium]
MRFAIKTSPQRTEWADMLAVFREADSIELFESGWTFDHFYPIGATDHDGPCLEGWVTLTALAQATTRLRVGNLVTGIHYRHPAVLANMAATLDIISGGRLELGIGAGWNEEESGAYGIELGTHASAATGSRRRARCSSACSPTRRPTSMASTTSFGRPATSGRGRSARIHRSALVDRVSGARCGPRRDSLSTGTTWAVRRPTWHISATCSTHIATRSAVIRRRSRCRATYGSAPDGDPRAVADSAAALGEAGMDLAIVVLPTPPTPAVLGPLADALAPLA